ncbi:MAG: glycosyltransferase family 2 protein [Gelidibacter sp.]
MPEQPLVSIIIPTYNRAHLIGETLDSVLAQTYTNWECIVVDDGSTDETEELLSTYISKDDRFQYHKRPDTHLPGGNGARNYGFELSMGEYVNWFDSDDLMQPEFLNSKMIAFTEKLELVICSGWYVRNNLSIIKDIDINVNTSLFKDYILKNAKIFTPSVLFRKSFLLKKPLFSCKLIRSQEAEFFSRVFFRISDNDYKIVNEPLFLYRQHLATKTGLDKVYDFNFKYAHFFVHLANFKRGVEINDQDIIQSCYENIILILIEAIKSNDKRLVNVIFDFLKKYIIKKQFVCIKVVVFLMKSTKFARYRCKAYLTGLNVVVNRNILIEFS